MNIKEIKAGTGTFLKEPGNCAYCNCLDDKHIQILLAQILLLWNKLRERNIKKWSLKEYIHYLWHFIKSNTSNTLTFHKTTSSFRCYCQSKVIFIEGIPLLFTDMRLMRQLRWRYSLVTHLNWLLGDCHLVLWLYSQQGPQSWLRILHSTEILTNN